ncbi:PPE family protein [Mycolicibacillus parakoreensis]|uniref:PPE family protein n=1 Tax=Mycolicibacillus parakoreensis TaxID=1069221 RepID=A0ABY3U8B2_9MYCO|nr:PPE family protein [Mycolicibacillus parakoreensis]MCV7314735.1 PPE family protein [Mycolicibacillus parakoreensis]ULN53742.1 PPE family protein [Mycolicibacillus parakoreensis]
MFMDFGAVPPEINAARIYTGPGAAPLLEAASAWQALAKELSTAAAAYQSQVSGLTAKWHGLSGQRMAAAAAPHIQWLNQTSAQAGQAGMQAATQAAAYETAFASMVPPPVIAANRSQKMALISTNFLNRNAPAIMATDAAYMQMWEQCAAAMYSYAASTEQSSTLPQFSVDRENTNQSSQAAATAKAAADGAAGAEDKATNPVTDYLSNLYDGYTPNDALNDTLEPPYRLAGIFKNSQGLLQSMTKTSSSSSDAVSDAVTGPTMVTIPGLAAAMGQGGGALGSAPAASAPLSASMANASRLGGLSVPGGWAGAAKALNPTLAAPNLGSALSTPNTAGHMLGGVPLSGAGAGAGRGIGDGVLRIGPRSFTMPRPLSAG